MEYGDFIDEILIVVAALVIYALGTLALQASVLWRVRQQPTAVLVCLVGALLQFAAPFAALLVTQQVLATIGVPPLSVDTWYIYEQAVLGTLTLAFLLGLGQLAAAVALFLARRSRPTPTPDPRSARSQAHR